jgi:hypothetical protein
MGISSSGVIFTAYMFRESPSVDSDDVMAYRSMDKLLCKEKKVGYMS